MSAVAWKRQVEVDRMIKTIQKRQRQEVENAVECGSLTKEISNVLSSVPSYLRVFTFSIPSAGPGTADSRRRSEESGGRYRRLCRKNVGVKVMSVRAGMICETLQGAGNRRRLSLFSEDDDGARSFSPRVRLPLIFPRFALIRSAYPCGSCRSTLSGNPPEADLSRRVSKCSHEHLATLHDGHSSKAFPSDEIFFSASFRHQQRWRKIFFSFHKNVFATIICLFIVFLLPLRFL